MQRLDKILQSQGFGGRKHCQHLIHSGQVQVQGEICRDDRRMFNPIGLQFSVAGQHWQYREKVYIALNKPAGFECSHQPIKHRAVFSLLPTPLIERGIQSVGRLDQDTKGLLLLTDDGQFLHALTHPRQHVPKRYHIQTAEPIQPAQLTQLQSGVMLHGESQPVTADNCTLLDTHLLIMTIHQGKYHQVKRMLAAVGNHVTALHRAQIGELLLADLGLAEGAWCYLNPAQIELAQQRLPFNHVANVANVDSPIN